MEISKIGILVGAAPLGAEKTFLSKILAEGNCFSLAADGGLSFFVNEGIAPDYWLGDRDSLEDRDFEKAKEIFPNLDIRPCAPEKDDTDMRMGMLKFNAFGLKKVLIFGGLGGERTDHTLANIQLIHEVADWEIRGILISEKEYMYVLKKGESITYPKDREGTISVFSLTDKTKLSLKDFYYEFTGIMDNKRALGVSNEFNQKGGTIEISEGAVLVIRRGFFPEDYEVFG